MHEILLDVSDQMKNQLQISDPEALAQQTQQVQQGQNRQNRPRKVKKEKNQDLKAEDLDASLNAGQLNQLKNEIEFMPMKTPISILQELLSRRGTVLEFLCKKLSIFQTKSFHHHKA